MRHKNVASRHTPKWGIIAAYLNPSNRWTIAPEGLIHHTLVETGSAELHSPRLLFMPQVADAPQR
jgi:hypothetical protein